MRPASVPVAGNQARVEGIILSRSEATTEPGRQYRRKAAADRRGIRGTTVQKLRFDAECLDFLHSPIEHPRALSGFPKLRIGVPRSWTGPGKGKAPPTRAGLRGTSIEVSPVSISDTTPIHLCPSPCGHHETPMPNNR